MEVLKAEQTGIFLRNLSGLEFRTTWPSHLICL